MYAKVTGGAVDKFPYTLRDLRVDNPNTSFPRDVNLIVIEDYNVAEVIQLADPAYDETTEYLVQGDPVFNDPNWQVVRVVTAMTQQEIDSFAAKTARQEDIDTLKADPQVLALLKKRPDETDAYIETNVTDLASAKQVLKILARTCAVLEHTVIN